MIELNELFKGIVEEALPNYAYLFERWSNAAEKVHSTDLPVVMNIVPKTQRLQLNEKQTKYGTTTSCLVAFFNLCPSLDASGEEVAAVVDECRNAAQKFLAHLVESYDVELVGDVNVEIAEASYAACLAGVVLDFQVKQKPKVLCGER